MRDQQCGTGRLSGRGSVARTPFAVMVLQVLRDILDLPGLGSFRQVAMTVTIVEPVMLLDRTTDVRQGEGTSGERRGTGLRSVPFRRRRGRG